MIRFTIISYVNAGVGIFHYCLFLSIIYYKMCAGQVYCADGFIHCHLIIQRYMSNYRLSPQSSPGRSSLKGR